MFLGTSKQLSTIIEGESLLNDGMAIVLYKIFFNLAFSTMTGEKFQVSLLVKVFKFFLFYYITIIIVVASVIIIIIILCYYYLLRIMCGYQCDKAVNKNDTREVI